MSAAREWEQRDLSPPVDVRFALKEPEPPSVYGPWDWYIHYYSRLLSDGSTFTIYYCPPKKAGT